jgi:hypothetical protein
LSRAFVFWAPGLEIGAGWRVWGASVLLPISQSRDGQVERLGKFRLRHSKTLSQHHDARYPAHLRQLLAGERLRVGVGQCGRYGLLISHGIEPRPIGVAPQQGVTRLYGHPRSTDLAHVVWPSGPI